MGDTVVVKAVMANLEKYIMDLNIWVCLTGNGEVILRVCINE
jgi:hypothetical protein